MEVRDSGFNLPNSAVLRRWGEDFPVLHLFLSFLVLIKSAFLFILCIFTFWIILLSQIDMYLAKLL